MSTSGGAQQTARGVSGSYRSNQAEQWTLDERVSGVATSQQRHAAARWGGNSTETEHFRLDAIDSLALAPGLGSTGALR